MSDAPRPPAKCIACQVNRVAWTRPRVDFCYQCLPGGPLRPPPCTRCGSSRRYFNNGLCEGCHPAGPLHPGSCEGCLGWGVFREYRWRCWNCRWWRTHYPEGTCAYCGQLSRISELRACRLCWEQGRLLQTPGRAVDLVGANRGGQQLFLANLAGNRRTPHHHLEPPTTAGRARKRNWPLPRLSQVASGQQFTPVAWHQLRLFDMAPDMGRVALSDRTVNDSDLLRFCDEVVRQHAAVHGWSPKQTNDVRRTLRLLSVFQDTPGARILASDVLRMPSLKDGLSAVSTIDVLVTAGLLIDDRTSEVERYFTKQVVGLPATMGAQMRLWFDVMINGSTTSPRRRPRDPMTAKLHIRAVAPALRIWAAQGHDSLAEIEKHQVLTVLPPSGPRRHLAEQGMHSLFGVLKARRAVFIDPTRGIPCTKTNENIPLPLDAEAIRNALDSADPATALAVALVAFHALASREVRALKLTDIVDGRLTVDRRTLPLAGPVLPRLTAWLDHRARRWPSTQNPHLFVSPKSAPRLTAVSRPFPWRQVAFRPQTLREDRILDEVRATGGDLVQICHLFGLSVG
ncbi:MAG TPA: hypothetical protein VFJ85_10180, partial [Acidimicrobiales bacterium]|nr:hypothetical protein [Acidimicrobiales bacterium]